MPSLYLHIPFCEHKCIYCDFYSIAPNGEGKENYGDLEGRFLNALEREIDLRGQDELFKTTYETIFIGGGTPSLLSPSTIEGILTRLATRFSIRADAEITVEANPGTVDLKKLQGYKSAGVNRMSFGIQSFHEDDLRFLTRIHTSEQARDNVQNAFRAGFENVSFDLIFALPGQTLERWKSNLQFAMELSPTHLSCYSLIVEQNTPLYRMVQSNEVRLVDTEDDAALYEYTIEYLDHAGFTQYEVSNFSRPGYKCRHNVNYWNHENYLSFGPSAHSFWEGKRWWNLSNVVGYADMLARGLPPVAGEEVLTRQQWIDETVLLGLRGEGIDLEDFRNRFQKNLLTEYDVLIDGLVNDGLATIGGERLRLTMKGYLVCDEICRSFR